jgi:hypothetical protein
LRSDSISPSDSVSHYTNPSHRETPELLTRPSQYPVEVLWHLEDCKADEDITATPGNISRPSMLEAIRHQDGRMISSAEYSAIRGSASMIKRELLLLPKPRDRRAQGRRKTKAYFRTWHPEEWQKALRKLEGQQPLLALCAAHWKADHVIGAALAGERHSKNDSNPPSNDENSDSDSPPENLAPTQPKKRSKTKSRVHAAKKAKVSSEKDTERAETVVNEGTSLHYMPTMTQSQYNQRRNSWIARVHGVQLWLLMLPSCPLSTCRSLRWIRHVCALFFLLP